MSERDFNEEFEQIMVPSEEKQSEKAKWDEWHMYALEDPDFHRSVVEHISRVSGVKTGREIFRGET